MEHDTRGVHISAGEGIVAHVANLTAHATGQEAGLNELLVRLNALAGEPWQEIVRTITSGIAEVGYDNHPALACVAVESDKVAALVFGDATLSVTIDGAETVLDGRDSSTWIDVALRGNVERVHAGEQSASSVVGVLRDGVIPAGGFLLDTSGPIPASGRWSEIMAAPAEVGSQNDSQNDDVFADVLSGDAVDSAPVSAGAAPASAGAATHDAAPEAEPEATPDEELAPAAPALTLVTDEYSGEETVDDSQVPEDATTPESEGADDQDPEATVDSNPTSPPTSRSMFARIEEIGRVGRALTAEKEKTSSELFSESPFTQRAGDGQSPAQSDAGQEDTAPGQTLAPNRPQLKGVLCDAGHLTAPLESNCRICGEPVAADAGASTGDRPILGTLTFDDGAVLNIDRPAAIGADVPTGYVIDGEPATIVRLDDGVGGVSDIQLEVRLSGWNVEIVDMNSGNGTYTMLRGERQTRTKLRSGQSVVLQREMEVQTGGRNFVYNAGPTAE